ncbi:hypothetical protein [Mycobacterium angelicum]|uniref:Uncharacterized protein n=1 Tax=Mycobacterium angelicum TaxID=470074 RepID=A0A1W9ZPY4_MYCAN|nr:hypothetical protein [Mycobacterium angelicum]ORA19586.1 hypothetical protein BST12_16685 [Mycobacterium angelicum]
MTTPSNPWGDERRYFSHQLRMRDQILSGWQARKLSQRFVGVGVEIAPRRLQQMMAGAPASPVELTDVNFALIATHLDHEKRAAKLKRFRKRSTHSAIFAGLVLVVLNFLFCLAYLFVNLTQQASPW